MQPGERCIGVSFSNWQKEQSGHKILLNLKNFCLNITHLKFYWKIRRFVSIKTRHGKRYTCFQSISLIWKWSSKYNCDLVFELLRDICRQHSFCRQQQLLHLSKEYREVVIIHGKNIRDAVTYTKFFSKILELHLSTESKNNVACYSNWVVF